MEEVRASDKEFASSEINFGGREPPGVTRTTDLQIPSARYTSQEFLGAEWNHLFPEVWLMAGFESDVGTPGEYFVFEHGDQSILVARNEDGTVGAFHNVCLHRGHLLREPGQGRCSSFICPYHRWEWGLDGRLCHVPLGGAFERGIPEERRRLAPVHCRLWEGQVWIHLGAPRESLEDYLGAVGAVVPAYGMDQFSIIRSMTLQWDTNWKNALDGFNETYHVSSVHPQYNESVDATTASWQFDDKHSLFIVKVGQRPPGPDSDEICEQLAGKVRATGGDPALLKGRVDEARKIAHVWIRSEATRTRIDVSRLTDAQLTDTHEFYVFPNLQFDFHGAHEMTVQRYRPHPSDPNRCFYDIYDLVRRGTVDEKPRLPHRIVASGEQGAGIVYEQDIVRLERVQRGMRTGRFPGPLISRMERRIAHMHHVIDRYVAQHVSPELRTAPAS